MTATEIRQLAEKWSQEFTYCFYDHDRRQLEKCISEAVAIARKETWYAADKILSDSSRELADMTDGALVITILRERIQLNFPPALASPKENKDA